MAAPIPAVGRHAPVGIRLDNGFSSTITFGQQIGLTLAIWEKSVQPPAIEGGDPIMTDTMQNLQYITKAPQCLEEWEDLVIIAAYDPAVLANLQSLINDPDTITLEYPDGTQLAFYGYLRRAEPAPLVKGVPPEITLTIVITNGTPLIV